MRRLWKANSSLMRSLKARRSSRVRESDLAMTGTTLTTSESFLRTTISIGLRLGGELSKFIVPGKLEGFRKLTYA